jgi:plasmid stabilization system protein ParE
MRLRVSSIAEAEIAEALLYYDQQSSGLGAELLLEYDAAVKRITTQPEAWRQIGPNSRRCLLRRFPYGVVYSVERDNVIVTAVMALRRDPNHWDDRIA